jgi:hypothetical protein
MLLLFKQFRGGYIRRKYTNIPTTTKKNESPQFVTENYAYPPSPQNFQVLHNFPSIHFIKFWTAYFFLEQSWKKQETFSFSIPYYKEAG